MPKAGPHQQLAHHQPLQLLPLAVSLRVLAAIGHPRRASHPPAVPPGPDAIGLARALPLQSYDPPLSQQCHIPPAAISLPSGQPPKQFPDYCPPPSRLVLNRLTALLPLPLLSGLLTQSCAASAARAEPLPAPPYFQTAVALAGPATALCPPLLGDLVQTAATWPICRLLPSFRRPLRRLPP